MLIDVKSFLRPYQAALLSLQNPILLKFALIPWFINILVFVAALGAFGALDKVLMGKLAETMGNGWWVPVTAWVLGILLFIGFSAGLLLSFIYIVNIFTGVFAEQLSFHAERIISGKEIPSPEGHFLAIWSRSIREELKGILFFLSIWLLLLLLYLIPVAGPVLFITASTIWSAFSLTFEFLAPAAERHELGFKEKRDLVFKNYLSSLWFGLSVLLLSIIPIVNFFFLPFAIIGGTIWFCEKSSDS